MRNVTYKNIKYGILVEVANLTGDKSKPFSFDRGYHSGMKVYFFNQKGVFLGNIYEFVPYERLRLREKKRQFFPRYFMHEPLESTKQFLFEKLCLLLTILIKFTQKHMHKI